MKKMLTILLTLVFALTLNAQPSKEYINDSFETVSKEVGIEVLLLKSVCWVESHHRPYAYRHSDAPGGVNALGMCQLLYSTAKGLGLEDEKCKRDFSNFSKSERKYSACKLFGPETNIRYAAIYLKSLLKKYNGNEYKAVLSYNAGRYVECENGWLHAYLPDDNGNYHRQKFKRCLKGGPVNMYYAHNVTSAMDIFFDKTPEVRDTISLLP